MVLTSSPQGVCTDSAQGVRHLSPALDSSVQESFQVNKFLVSLTLKVNRACKWETQKAVENRDFVPKGHKQNLLHSETQLRGSNFQESAYGPFTDLGENSQRGGGQSNSLWEQALSPAIWGGGGLVLTRGH